MNRVYMAGPVQHADDYGVGWRERLKDEYDCFEWADPLDVYHDNDDVSMGREWTDEEIIEKDLEMVFNADGVIVGWDDVPSAGTPMEVFFASAVLGRPVVVRYDGDELSPWMSGHADAAETTWPDAVDALQAVFDGANGRGDSDAVPYQYDARAYIQGIRDEAGK